MGGSASAPRTLVVNNDDCNNTAVIQVSRDVAERIMNRSEVQGKDASPPSKPAPSTPPAEPKKPTGKEKAAEGSLAPPPSQSTSPPPHKRGAAAGPPAPASSTYRVGSDSTQEYESLRAQEALHKERIKALEQMNAELLATKLAEFSESLKRVEDKYLSQTAPVVCSEMQAAVYKCYADNPHTSLNCATQVRDFNECTRQYRKGVASQ